MSQAPRPKTFSSLMVATNGSVFQSLETGTTSVCPEKIIGFFLLGIFAFNVANRLTLFFRHRKF